MTGGESRHKDVGLRTFDGIVVDTRVDGLQDVVGTEAERTDIQGGIRNEAEQMGGVLDHDGGGFIDSLPDLPQKLFNMSLAVALRPRFLAMLLISSRMPFRSW